MARKFRLPARLPARQILFLTALLTCSSRIWAQPAITEYSNGLTSNGVPYTITLGPDGALWFTEAAADRIGRITTTGVISEIVLTAGSEPNTITTGPDGALWFTEHSSNKIARLSVGGGVTEYKLPSSGSEPLGIAAGPDGALWFVERVGKIGRITTGGSITNEYTLPTMGASPVNITKGPDGALWFTEQMGNNIGRITTSGTIVEYAVPTVNSQPLGITAGPDGNLWFTESGGYGKIGRITPAGAFTEFNVANGPYGITTGPDGALWFTESGGAGFIGRITTGGLINTYPTPTSASQPLGITSGPDTALWFTEAARIGRASLVAPSSMTLSQNVLNFGISNTSITSPQLVTIGFTAGTAPSWTAASNQSNIMVSPTSGAGNGVIQISVSSGSSGTVTVTAPGASNSPLQIQVNVLGVIGAVPFGSFDTPVNNTSGVAGAIPVTGWALDSVEAISVDIWREPVTGEAAGSGPNGLVFIGNALFVSGARPDVQNSFQTTPFNYRAGWGYLLLTNFLPNSSGSGPSGNGTYKLHAIAHNKDGALLDLGTSTISVDNVHAAKPFGTLDTPVPGATVSGTGYVNFGWALTQNPYFISTNGSTITVYLDGQPRPGNPVYNQYRSDIANAFPGLANSNGAVGYYVLDTTRIANGVHTIAWVVFDNASRGDGIGSRYFNVFNTSSTTAGPEEAQAVAPTDMVTLRRGFDRDREPEPMASDQNGAYSVEIEELGRMELRAGVNGGYMLVNGERHPLPDGSSLNDGVFYWQPGPGFVGEYQLELTRPNADAVRVRVKIWPKSF